MKIGIDAHVIGKIAGGTETVLLGLIGGLARIDRDNEYILYTRPGQSLERLELPSNFRLRPLPLANPWLQRTLVMPWLCNRDHLDVIHFQRALPLCGCRRSLLHMHDAHLRTHPQLFPPLRRRVLDWVFARSGRRAARIVTGSHTSQSEIQQYYGVPPAKIVVVPYAVDHQVFFREADPARLEAVRQRLGLSGRTILHVGVLERHKNLHVLVEALALLRRDCPDVRLVIVGGPSRQSRRGYSQELRRQVNSLSLADHVVFVGHLGEDDLRLLLNVATLLAFPSSAEGFGLPPLEAMACGLPVVASDLAVLRELYEPAALLTPVGDAQALAGAMRRVMNEPGLSEEMSRRGLELARRYHWDQSARRLLDVYTEVAGMGKV